MRRPFATAMAFSIAISCNNGDIDELTGTYELISENGRTLPADPHDEGGCCITLSGSLAFTGDQYELEITYRNKNTDVVFDNFEYGTYDLDGRVIEFDRIGGDGINVPFLLAPALVDGRQIVVRYGDEGPGSDQIVAIFER